MRPQHSLLHLATATLLFTLLPTPVRLSGSAEAHPRSAHVEAHSPLSPPPALAQSTQDRKAESIRLNNEGEELRQRGQFRAALEKYQQALAIVKAIGDREGKGAILNNIGLVYSSLGQYPKALEFYQQALAIVKAIGDRLVEGTTLNNIGLVYSSLGQYPKALEFYQQALAISKQVGDRLVEGTTLNNIGYIYFSLGQYPKALEFYQQALAISKQVGDRLLESRTFNSIGLTYFELGQYPKALEFYQQALAIDKAIGDRAGEGGTLNNISGIYNSLGQYPKALEFYQQALTIQKEIGDRASAGTTVNNIGTVYSGLGQYSKALEFYQQALAIRKEIDDRAGEGNTLNNIGYIYFSLGQYPKALEFYQQALAIRKEIGDRAGEGGTLNNIGGIYNSLGQYPRALKFYQQALAIRKEIGDRAGEGNTLNNIGYIYFSLGQYPKALEFYQQALAIRKEIGDRAGEGGTLNNIGGIYNSLGQYPRALKFYQQALAICKEIGDRAGEGGTLNNIGLVYFSLRQYPKALEFYQQALGTAEAIGDRSGEGTTLNNVGGIYQRLGQYPKALEFYQQSLAVSKEIGDRAGEGETLNNIGYLLEAQKQPELSIIFFKRSVSIWEAIREELRVLPKAQQESYTKTVEQTYRKLADLLLKQDRVLEAQRVLDLLKVQELADFLRNVRGNERTAQGVDLLPTQQQIWDAYDASLTQLVQLGKALAALDDIAKTRTLTTAEDQRRLAIEKDQRLAQATFVDFLKSDRIQNLVQQLTRLTGGEALNPKQLTTLQDNLRQLNNAVVLYPIIFDDRLELVLATPYAPPIRRPVPVKREELNQAMLEFRRALTDPRLDAKAPAQKLYNWLIKPLEAPLKQANAKTILYAPDGQLRYIPLAALYDGKQWLTQRFAINNITALSLTDLGKAARPLKILAAAYTENGKPYNFRVGNVPFSFTGLRFAGVEVKNLVSLIPGTTPILDEAFSLDGILQRMRQYSILHLATHAEFINGQPEQSFILLGNGDRIRFRDLENPDRGIESWRLPNTDLVVLSACKTGVGEALGDGREILGFGYLIQQTSARASLSSLWSVDDGGTQALMNTFYANLKQGDRSKVEALQQAQIALITSQDKGTGDGQRASLRVSPQIRDTLAKRVNDNLSHPYYWAPFILIGNGL